MFRLQLHDRHYQRDTAKQAPQRVVWLTAVFVYGLFIPFHPTLMDGASAQGPRRGNSSHTALDRASSSQRQVSVPSLRRGSAITPRQSTRPTGTNYVPHSHKSRNSAPISGGPVRTAAVEIIDDMSFEPAVDEFYSDDSAFATEDFVDCGACQSCGAFENCLCQPFGWLLDWSRSDLWIGTCGFSGAAGFLDRGAGTAPSVAGNFGFQEGFNFGTRLPGVLSGQLGTQMGMRFTQSQFDGTTAGDDRRMQTFATIGLFRRVDYGLQGGVVVDYLRDDWVYQADLLQLRGELSFLFSRCHDLGFRFTDRLQTDDVEAWLRGSDDPLQLSLSALNTYRFFYRARFGHNAAGVGEINAGFTEDSAAILGANLRAPLQNQLGLEVGTSYLLPASQAEPPYAHEGWNLSMALVWTPGRSFGSARDYYRPLLDVASNGSLWTVHAQR